MAPTLPGLHHVTAITADAQANIDFYCNTLGLRLVKLTVNFDDPGSYHLYYGDELGRPGTIMTFFAWPGAYRGTVGTPQVTSTAFAVPAGSIERFWASRLSAYNPRPADRLGERAIHISDPDGMGLDLVEVTDSYGQPWARGPVAVKDAIRGFHGITISEEGYEATARILTDLMAFKAEKSEDNRFRYRASNGDGFASIVDLICVPDAKRGSMSAGVVHHVAFRTPDDAQQGEWRSRIVRAGLNVSPVMDRSYFHSIYYREPGGVLFEIATNNPGFTADEPADQLGTKLRLPKQLEKYRDEIERALPAVKLPQS